MKYGKALYRPPAQMNQAAFENLIRPHFLPSEQVQIMRAYRLAKYGHRTQKREGGGRYFDHVRDVAVMHINLGVRDAAVIIADLLHDVIEDQFILLFDDIEAWFGARACHFVRMVTKVKERTEDEYYQRLANDTLYLPGSWLVKCGDRTHNMSTLVDGTVETREHFRQKKINQVQGTRLHVLPLAMRLSRYPGSEVIGRWYVHQLKTWCDVREKEAA